MLFKFNKQDSTRPVLDDKEENKDIMEEAEEQFDAEDVY